MRRILGLKAGYARKGPQRRPENQIHRFWELRGCAWLAEAQDRDQWKQHEDEDAFVAWLRPPKPSDWAMTREAVVASTGVPGRNLEDIESGETVVVEDSSSELSSSTTGGSLS